MLFKLGEYPCRSGSSFASFAVFTPQPRRQSPSPRLSASRHCDLRITLSRAIVSRRRSGWGCLLACPKFNCSLYLNRYPNLSSLVLRYQHELPAHPDPELGFSFLPGSIALSLTRYEVCETFTGPSRSLFMQCGFRVAYSVLSAACVFLSGRASPGVHHPSGLTELLEQASPLVPTIRGASRPLLQPKVLSLPLAN